MMRALMLVSCLLPVLASAIFSMPTPVPVERLVTNYTAHLAEAPNDPSRLYTLGRIHYLAFATRSGTIQAYNPDRELPKPVRGLVHERIDPLQNESLLDHASKADTYLSRAIELRPNQPLYHLTLGSLYRVILKLRPADDRFSSLTTPQAIDAFHRAFELTYERDEENNEELPLMGLWSLISYEAGKSFLDLSLPGDPRRPQVEDHIEKLEKLPRGFVTPIILSLQKGRTLSEMVAPDVYVAFDLDGDLELETRSWVAADTGILVWDPERTGEITSGRQLFGSVTWWIFWENGYEALHVLDDNRDGELRGEELAGMRVWFDRNQDGTSDEGEVVDLADLEIVALSVVPDTSEAGVLSATHGMEMTNGLQLPTWDWVAD